MAWKGATWISAGEAFPAKGNARAKAPDAENDESEMR